MSIDDELAALRRERPKPDTTLADCLIDLLESILSPDTGTSVDQAVKAYTDTLNAHIDRRVGRYVRSAEIIG